MSIGALTNRVRQNYTRGVLSQQIAAAALSATSADFTAIPEVIQGDQFALLALDPDAVNGAPELAKITEHAAGSDTIIIERHMEDTLARLHPVATVWRIVSTADDFALIEQLVEDEFVNLDLALTGYLPLAGGIMAGDLLANGNDIDMGGGSVTNLPSPPVAGNTAITQDFTDTRYVQLTGGPGGIMTGPLSMSGQQITSLGDPTGNLGALNRQTGDARYSPTAHNHAGVYSPASHDNSHHAVAYSSNPHGNAHHSVSYSQDNHTHSYAAASHGNGAHSGDGFAGANHTHSYIAISSIGTLSGLKFDELIPYHSASNGSLRWMGTNVEVAQAHTSSSVDYKTDVEDIDLTKSVFSRLNPIHFRYRDDHPFKDRWDDWENEQRPGTGRMGLTYEDVAEAVPEWVYDADGMKCIGYEAMLPDLIADYLALRRLVLDSLGV